MFRSIRFKLVLISLLLVSLVTVSTLFIVMGIMDRIILDQVMKRGVAVANSASTSAAYSILSDDRLALDNLTVKIKDMWKDILNVTAVDNNGIIVAHNDLARIGTVYEKNDGVVVRRIDGATVQRVTSENNEKYEISMPIRFSSKFLGSIHIDMSTGSIDAAQSAAARNIIIVSVLILSLGAFGVFILSRFITVPIELLTQGVSKLAAEKYDGEIRVMSDDEIGRLTRNFNRMAKLITEQKGKLRHHAKELEEAYIATIKVLAAAIDARDPHTLGHSARVSRLSRLLGERLGLGYEELKELEMACLLHDVGKIRTPDSILHKEDRLDREEYSLMMEHTNDGADILGLVDSLKALIPAVKHHHEWYDGSGYPDGLKGNDIPLYAAILAITDAYDAMMSTRPYKGPRSHHEAINELIEYKGAQFDPKLTDLFIEIVMDEVRNEEAARLGID